MYRANCSKVSFCASFTTWHGCTSFHTSVDMQSDRRSPFWRMVPKHMFLSKCLSGRLSSGMRAMMRLGGGRMETIGAIRKRIRVWWLGIKCRKDVIVSSMVRWCKRNARHMKHDCIHQRQVYMYIYNYLVVLEMGERRGASAGTRVQGASDRWPKLLQTAFQPLP